MSNRAATEALIRRCVAACNKGFIKGLLDANRECEARVTSCYNLQDRIARVALG